MMGAVLRRIEAHRASSDAGIGLILVLGMTAVATIVILTITTIGIRSLQSSNQHLVFEQSLAAAEAGIDHELGAIQSAYNGEPSVDYSTASPCNTTSPTPTFTSANSERDWARSVLVGLPSSCTQTMSQGQYVAFRPADKQVVYSMGWAPSRTASNAHSRLLKAEYIFGPYKPADAILTDGDLNFSGSVTVTIASPAYASNIHSNGAVTTTGAGSSLNVAGSISASGSNSLAGANGACTSNATISGTCTSTAAPERAHVLKPRQVYDLLAASSPKWYDLCPDGTVRTPSTTTPTTPCSGTPLSVTNGWSCTGCSSTSTPATPPTWTLAKSAGTTTYPGAYYIYHGNAQVGANGNDSTPQNISVLAEPGTPGVEGIPSTYTNSASCNKYGGNIDWELFTISNYLDGTVFIAGGNLTGTANTDAGDGLFSAEDKVDLKSSSNTLTGAIVAGNECAAAGTNNVQGAKVVYDQNAQVPISSIIDTTLWLEYVG